MAQRKRPFLSRNGRWIAATGVLGVMLAPFLAIEQLTLAVGEAVDRVHAAPEGLGPITVAQDILFYVAMPTILTLAVVSALFGIAYLVIATAFALFFPTRFRGYFDGLLHSATLVLAIMATQIFPINTNWLVACTLFFALTYSPLWARLPWSFTYRDTAQLDLDMPLDLVRARLVPNVDPTVELADAVWINASQSHIFAQDDLVDLNVTSLKNGAVRVTDPAKAPGYAYRIMEMRLTALDADTTRIDLDITIKRCALYDFWDFWTRPFADDYADYLYARLSGEPDRSRYGSLLAPYLRKTRRTAAKSGVKTA